MQNWGFKTALRLMAIMAVMAGMLTILGCPSEEEEQVAVNPVVQATSTSIKAIDDKTFTFSSGAPAVFPGFSALATQPTTVTFDTTPATPIATVVATNVRDTSGNLGAKYTAESTFTASCTFKVITSTFPVNTGPQVGQTFTVTPCTVNPQGTIQATGQATTVQILLQLGQTPSAQQQAQVAINTDGTVVINTVNTGQTVVLQVVTGGAGG